MKEEKIENMIGQEVYWVDRDMRCDEFTIDYQELRLSKDGVTIVCNGGVYEGINMNNIFKTKDEALKAVLKRAEEKFTKDLRNYE